MHVHLHMPEDMLRALSQKARAEDVSVGQIVRDAVAAALSAERHPKKTVRADEALLASLRSLLAQDLADAKGWYDLDQRLKGKGFMLRPAGGGLILCRTNTGDRICKASELGYAHGTLARRFGESFPNHPQPLPDLVSSDLCVIET